MSEIKTVAKFYEIKIKEKGSVFIAQVHPVSNAAEAEDILEEIRRKYYDATHHCFCYQLSSSKFRYSDDGEPSGTAGIRIRNAIQHFRLTNILVAVIRYFGGVKLGTGPLGKAYYSSAISVLEHADKIIKSEYYRIRIIFDYDQTSFVHHILANHEIKNIKNIFEENPAIDCLVKYESFESFKKQIEEIGKNKIEIKILEDSIIV